MGVANGNVGLAFGLVIAAGLSTTIGSAFVFCSSYANTKLLAAALGVSAGVMIYVSFVEIFTLKAVEGFTTEYGDDASKMATFCFFSGAGVTYLLDGIVHQIGAWQKKKSGKAGAVCVCHTEPADMLNERSLFSDAPGVLEAASLEQSPKGGHGRGFDDIKVDLKDVNGAQTDSAGDSLVNHPAAMGGMKIYEPDRELLKSLDHPIMTDFDSDEKENLKNMGVMTAVAIGIHNFPEGLATFVAALADTKLGIALALAIAVHNIPEGICVAMPVYYATGSKWKGFWWSFVSGLSEPFGGLCGYLILYGGNMTDTAYGALFGVVGGMMVYISLKELLPTAHKYDPHDHYVTNCMFAGMVVMALSLFLFTL